MDPKQYYPPTPPSAPKPSPEEMQFLEVNEKNINDTIGFALDFLAAHLEVDVKQVIDFADKRSFPMPTLLSTDQIIRLRIIQEKLKQLAYRYERFKPYEHPYGQK